MSFIETSDQKLLEIRWVRFGRERLGGVEEDLPVQCFVLEIGVDFNSVKMISFALWSIGARVFVNCSYELTIS